MSAWGITDGSAGMVAQVKALAGALNQPLELKTVTVKKPYVYLPNAVHAALLRRRIVPGLIAPGSDALAAPWPKLVISCGRRGALVAMGLKAHTPPFKPLYIHIQDPQVKPSLFDIVVAMAHDKVAGDNVIKTRFALHGITPQLLQRAREEFAPRFSGFPAPRVAVLLGGSTNKYTLTSQAMRQVIASLQAVLECNPCSLLITPSRRTGTENTALLRAAFAGNPRVYIYDFIEPNPYLGLLALADTIIASDDSVNMMSEAHATGKPLYLLHLPGHAGSKPARFAAALVTDGIARPLDGGALEQWRYAAGDEMEKLAKKLETRLANFDW